MNFKTITHWFAAGIIAVGAFAVSPAGQALIKQYPYLSGIATVVALILALYHNPQKALPVILLAALLFAPGAMAQTPALPDAPTAHVSVSATFTGFNAGGKMHAANIDTFGLELTEYVTIAYEHVSVPDFGARYELGLVNYHNTLPKFKAVLFDTSNFVYSFGAGAGKYLSPQGNHWAETATASLTYPVAAHMGWQVVSYQYIHAPVSGFINKSYQTASTGPIFFF